MDKLFQLQSLNEVKDYILVEMRETKKLYKYTDLPNARELAQQIDYSCVYYFMEDFKDLNKNEFPSEVGTYLFHKVFMDYCPYLYIKWYDDNSLKRNERNPLLNVEDHKAAVKALKNTYAKDFSGSEDKMVFIDLKRTVLGNLLHVEEQHEEMLKMHRNILANRNLSEKKVQKELTEMLEILQGIDAQTKNLKNRFEKLVFEKS